MNTSRPSYYYIQKNLPVTSQLLPIGCPFACVFGSSHVEQLSFRVTNTGSVAIKNLCIHRQIGVESDEPWMDYFIDNQFVSVNENSLSYSVNFSSLEPGASAWANLGSPLGSFLRFVAQVDNGTTTLDIIAAGIVR